MDYDAILDQVVRLLQREQCLSYRVLKRRLQLDDETLEDLKEDLIYAKQLAVDEAGRVLVWAGGAGTATAPGPGVTPSAEPPDTGAAHALQAGSSLSEPQTPDAERRQLTVLFCDLVDSTALSSQLDPEEWREVVRAYQEVCAKVIARFEGPIAQYLGDGVLVYFGYPLAHEDDAQRAVRAGLGMVDAVSQLNPHLAQERGVSLAVHLGIHTGQVVVGEIGAGAKHELLALGETPNVAARLQGLAASNTVVINAATIHLRGGFFACQSLGTPTLKGVSQSLGVYQVLSERMARSRLETVQRGLHQLVAAEFLYQRGVPPRATYRFKHALIQGAAYQSLLRSTRQQYHQRIAQVLTERFPDTAETQPELLAHHYTEAGLRAQALPYRRRAGHIAQGRSAHNEAIAHLNQGLRVLAPA